MCTYARHLQLVVQHSLFMYVEPCSPFLLQANTGMPSKLQRYTCSGRHLENWHTLADYNISKESTLWVHLNWRGLGMPFSSAVLLWQLAEAQRSRRHHQADRATTRRARSGSRGSANSKVKGL